MASWSSSSTQRSSGTTMPCSVVKLDDDLLRHEEEAVEEIRRGPWTVEEDLTLVNYIADHGDGRWNSLARAAGLKRTGKSCRLRWLNYLRPDVKRGNFTADEQLLILDLHSRWGNRWSKIAQHLPGRTDNEIKNYWRTRVQKHAKQLNCDANSSKFKDAMKYLWMPRLADHHLQQASTVGDHLVPGLPTSYMESSGMVTSSSDSFASESYDGARCTNASVGEMIQGGDWVQEQNQGFWPESNQTFQPQDSELSGWVQGFSESESLAENFWSLEDIWKMQ
ncbi:hypothetical protein CFC21_070407 [Triticum aestivum]|uniref:Uncharacterized protein n=2 Tax=Triticum aestivum TaxID=4565 RepID=A0A3B6LHK9_WHEAT|nr:transcription factor JAMYB-like [Triticum aestivum]KAF7063952.1 hypothetical protein CFC21_070407 [Triticum aestivum]